MVKPLGAGFVNTVLKLEVAKPKMGHLGCRTLAITTSHFHHCDSVEFTVLKDPIMYEYLLAVHECCPEVNPIIHESSQSSRNNT